MGPPCICLLLILQFVWLGANLFQWGALLVVVVVVVVVAAAAAVNPFASDLLLFPHPVSYTHVTSLTGDGWSEALVLIFSPL